MKTVSSLSNNLDDSPVLGIGGALIFFLLSITVSFSGCTFSSEKLEFERAEKSERSGKHAEALKHYKSIVDRDRRDGTTVQAAKEAGRLDQLELKNYREAIEMYRYVILYSTSEKERIEAQKHIAEICFTNIPDYSQAITEYNRLLELPHTPEEGNAYRLAIARSYFYQNNFYQAQVELDQIVKTSTDKKMIFEALLLKANLFLTTKKLDDAIEVLKKLMTENPDRAKAESIGLVLEVCYEEKKDFAKAIEVLESMLSSDVRHDFIVNKIKALKERQSFLPGAKGLKK